MTESSRIYLDNAATSFPKPESVYTAVDNYNRRIGAAVGRSAYRHSVDVQRTITRCRSRAARLLGTDDADRVVFTFNASDSLNIAIQGVLQPGDHVVTSQIEHNSVLRPLRELQIRAGVDVTHVEADATGRVDAKSVANALRPNTKLVVLIHASNVTGTIQPIADVGEIVRATDAIFLVDAAQTAGHIPIDLAQLPVDLLACAGHKGLLGPLGTGLLYVRPGIEDRVRSFRQGGTGSHSEDDRQPDSLPDKYETGNHNAPGLFGLDAALDYLDQRGVDAIGRHEYDLISRLLDGLEQLPQVHSHGTATADGRVGVASITVDGYEPQVLASVLDDAFGIQTRAGLHCAPGVHRCLGTIESGGTVRLSVGPFNTSDDIGVMLDALRDVTGN